MTNEKYIIEVLNAYEEFLSGEKVKYIIIGSTELSQDNAELIEFQSEDKSVKSSAVVYPDGTTFVLFDWQGAYPHTEDEIEEYNHWVCANNNHDAVVFNGLPRLLF